MLLSLQFWNELNLFSSAFAFPSIFVFQLENCFLILKIKHVIVFGAFAKSPTQNRVIIWLGFTHMDQTPHNKMEIIQYKILYHFHFLKVRVSSKGHNLYTIWCTMTQRARINIVKGLWFQKLLKYIIIFYFRRGRMVQRQLVGVMHFTRFDAS